MWARSAGAGTEACGRCVGIEGEEVGRSCRGRSTFGLGLAACGNGPWHVRRRRRICAGVIGNESTHWRRKRRCGLARFDVGDVAKDDCSGEAFVADVGILLREDVGEGVDGGLFQRQEARIEIGMEMGERSGRSVGGFGGFEREHGDPPGKQVRSLNGARVRRFPGVVKSLYGYLRRIPLEPLQPLAASGVVREDRLSTRPVACPDGRWPWALDNTRHIG